MDSSDKPETVFTHGTDAEEKIPRLSEQPQKWTHESVSKMYFEKNGTLGAFFDELAAAHNAALAAVHEERSSYIQERHREQKALADALAAEREKVKPLVDALQKLQVTRSSEHQQIISDALAKEGK